MRKKGLSWIIHELTGDRQPKGAPSDAMDVDEKPTVPKTAALAAGSTVQPKRTIDLENMAFSQGGHLVSNEKCTLPGKLFKRVKKGYKEIHIPTPKQKPTIDSENVPISLLPAWAHEPFTVPKLSGMQRKLYPVALGTDKPILLCAPTGVGKVHIIIIRLFSLTNACPTYQHRHVNPWQAPQRGDRRV